MNPAQVAPTARAEMGAIKRFYDRISCTATSSGTPNVQTLTYAQAPQALVAGDLFCFLVGSGLTNTGPVTLDVGTGPQSVQMQGGIALAGGEMQAGHWIIVGYSGAGFNVICCNSFSGPFSVHGGSIGLDNSMEVGGRGTDNLYHNMIVIDGSNNLILGDSSLQNICFSNVGGNCGAYVDQDSSYRVGANGVIGHTVGAGSSLQMRNTYPYGGTTPGAYFAAYDDGHAEIGTVNGIQVCRLNNSILGFQCAIASDERLKTEVTPLGSAAEEGILRLRPVSFEWKNPDQQPKGRRYGFVAQEVAQQFPTLVHEGSNGMLDLEYTGLIAPMVETIQVLSKRIAALEAALKRGRRR